MATCPPSVVNTSSGKSRAATASAASLLCKTPPAFANASGVDMDAVMKIFGVNQKPS
jgi:hypothetical protein